MILDHKSYARRVVWLQKNEQTIPRLLVLSLAILVAVKLAVSIDKAANGKIAGANLVIYGETHCIG